ncbi:MAG: ParB/RepB/Spo0J family partition protein, partial [Chloroflexota bacterium]|nr:ParB/RepB/Spo0J family partition protein [Chloroflexota bacterium]
MASRPQQRGVGAFFQALQPTGVEDLEGAQLIDITRLAPNPFQPRKEFDGDKLRELTLSIKQVGVLQPLLVRHAPDDEGSYQIAAGERRYRAGQFAGLLALPCTVRDLDDEAMETLAL